MQSTPYERYWNFLSYKKCLIKSVEYTQLKKFFNFLSFDKIKIASFKLSKDFDALLFGSK